jgi:DNA-binding NtrC family response regulator
VESPRICVIDNSPAVRETLAVILSDEYGVQCLSPEEFRRAPSSAHTCDALVIGENCALDEASSALPSHTPVLWLHTGSAPPPFARGRWATVSPAFDPQELRATLRRLLGSSTPPRPTWNARLAIDYPVVPKEVVLLARRAGHTTLPVLLSGAVGTGKARLARAIHALGAGGRFVHLPASACTPTTLVQAAGLTAGNLTLFVSDLAEASTESQQVLRELLDCGGVQTDAGWHAVRLVCATTETFDDLGRRAGFGKDLFYRLSVLPITLPRLRERVGDIPALVRHLSAELTRELSLTPVSFTPRAMERLERYLWFGNLAELETVLTRTIALAHSVVIDQNDLLFGYGRLTPQPADAGDQTPAAPVREPSSIETVDLLINELAHEFKNPLAMIKTVSQHFERLLEDDDGRQQVARLTNEAVSRMDRTLDNLLQFTRFREPVPNSITLNGLLTSCLTDLTPLLTERRLRLNYHPPDLPPVYADPAQLAHAFENLLRVIVRDLAEGETLTIRALDASPAVVFEFTSGHPSTAGKLATFLDHAQAGDAADAPLGLVFARVLVARNGGHLAVRCAGQKTTITVWLPSQEALASDDGKTARSNGKTPSANS